MPKKPILILFLLWCCSLLSAQTERVIVPISFTADQGRRQSPAYDIPLNQAQPFLSYFVRWDDSLTPLKIRFSRDQQHWTDWHPLERDEHSPELPLSRLGFTEADMRYFQLETTTVEEAPIRISTHFFSPGLTTALLHPDRPRPARGRSCTELAPPVIARTDWCPDGSCAEHPNPVFADISHLVIHHSAGSNQSDDWPAVVRAIWDFHVNGRGWSDIGYNWLVDPEGRVYAGRTDDAVGAHYCGANTGTIGICVLGNFTEVAPTDQALSALQEVLSWKSCANNIDPLAEAYHASSDRVQPTIIGHRDGCATACPGDLLYPLIPALRAELADEQTTAVREQASALPFQVYPNPSSGPFTVVFRGERPAEVLYALYNMQGQVVPALRSLPADGRVELSPQLAAGTYLLVLRSGAAVLGRHKLILHGR